MSHRTQITLTDDQYARLQKESDLTGLALAELVRRALVSTYGETSSHELVEALEESFGAWRDRDQDGEAYVEAIRRGMARRLEL